MISITATGGMHPWPMKCVGVGYRTAMAVGRDGSQINRANLLSHHKHFALRLDEAARVLDEVASWEEELKDYYGLWLKGDDLRVAREAVSSTRMRQ